MVRIVERLGCSVKTAGVTGTQPVVPRLSRVAGPGCTVPSVRSVFRPEARRVGGVLCALLAAATCLGVSACDSTGPLPPAVFVMPATLTIEDGQSAKLTASLRNPKTRTVHWSSTRPAVATVDIDDNPRLAARYGVRSVPTVMLFAGGDVKRVFVGARSAQEYRSGIDELLH